MVDHASDLTEGATREFVDRRDFKFANHQGPIVQLLTIIKIDNPNPNRHDRYRLVLSDGRNFILGILAPQMNCFVTSGQIVDNALIRVQDYVTKFVRNVNQIDVHVVVVLHLEVVNGGYGRMIGNPSDIEFSLDASSNPSRATRTSTDDSSLRQLGDAIAEEMKCPISQELLVDPVTAEDGFHYEREEIVNYMKHIRENNLTLRSPKTNLPMGERLNNAIAARNTIQRLVESGAIGGERVQLYRQRSLVVETQKKATKEDVEAMRLLATWYTNGLNGLEKCPRQAYYWKCKAEIHFLMCRVHSDDAEAMCIVGKAHSTGQLGLDEDHEKAFYFFDMAASKMNPHGMARAGDLLAEGIGTAKDEVRGTTLVAASAAMRSDYGCYLFGMYYLFGHHGIDLDLCLAKYWLERAIEIHGKSKFATLDHAQVSDAKAMLHQIDIVMS